MNKSWSQDLPLTSRAVGRLLKEEEEEEDDEIVVLPNSILHYDGPF